MARSKTAFGDSEAPRESAAGHQTHTIAACRHTTLQVMAYARARKKGSHGRGRGWAQAVDASPGSQQR
jgi:hypothetical protein